jgi:heptosyltransferase-2
MKPTRVLIIQTASLGDVILSTSLAETLHNLSDDFEIDFLIKDGYQGLFENHPFVKEVLVWNKSHKKYKRLINLITKVRSNKYDVVLNIHRFASSGVITALSGAKVKAGFTKNPLSLFYTHKVVHNIGDNSHETQRNKEILNAVYEGAKHIDTGKPRLYPSASDFASTAQLINNKYITISPASLYFTKRLPGKKWIEFIDRLPEDLDVVLLGSKADSELCELIIKSCKKSQIINLSGRLSFLESAAVMSKAVINYVNDSAPLHIASSMNAPVVAVFCSTVPAFGFGPLSDRSYIVETTVELSCRPCGLHGYQKCPLDHFKCAETISVNQLLLPLTYESGN